MEHWRTEKFKLCRENDELEYSFHNYLDLHSGGMMTGFSLREYCVLFWKGNEEAGRLEVRQKSQLKATQGDFEIIEDTSDLQDFERDIILKHLGKCLEIYFKREIRRIERTDYVDSFSNLC